MVYRFTVLHNITIWSSTERKYVSAFSNHISDKKTSTEKVLSSLAHEAAKETLATHRTNSATSSPSATMFDSPASTSARMPALSYNLGRYCWNIMTVDELFLEIKL